MTTESTAPASPVPCCDRNCASQGHVCVSAEAETPVANVAAKLELAAAPAAPAPTPAPKPSTIENVIDTVTSVASPVASVIGGPLGHDLDIGIAALRALEAIVQVVKGTNRSDEHQVVSAAVVLHDVASVLEAHDAAANAALAAKALHS